VINGIFEGAVRQRLFLGDKLEGVARRFRGLNRPGQGNNAFIEREIVGERLRRVALRIDGDKDRRDFIRLKSGRRWVTPAFVLQAAPRPEGIRSVGLTQQIGRLPLPAEPWSTA